MGTPQAIASTQSLPATVAVAAVGILFFVGSVYLLAYVFDFDRAVIDWVRRHT